MFIYYLTSFLSGFALMSLEIVSSRIVAPIIGASLYTWTAVIGVTLLGLTVGAFVGGRLADAYATTYKEMLISFVALVAAISTYAVMPISKNLDWLMDHTSSIILLSLSISFLLFFLPATCIGTLSPILLKLCADNMQNLGKRYGSLSSLWSLGSILGVFVTGFYLVSTMGSAGTVYSVSALFLLISFAYFAIYFAKKNKNLENK